jgi:hypothetical protein
MLIGHSQILSELNRGLPPVSLFVGPASVGKWTTAEHVRRELGVEGTDLIRVRKLYMEDAHNLVRFASTAPLGDSKLAIVRLSGAQPGPIQVLLKALEETAPNIHFILIDTKMPIDTVVTRARLFQFRLLTERQMVRYLTEIKRFKPETAQAVAKLAGGQISRAMARVVGDDAKKLVLDLLRLFETRNPAGLTAIAQVWTDEHTELLTLWCTECVSGRWNYFADEDVQFHGKDLPMKILTALRTDARPRLVVRASLANVLKGEMNA